MVIGCSAGGIRALQDFLSRIKPGVNVSFIIVIHRLKNVKSELADLFQVNSKIPVNEVWDKMQIKPGEAYLAPANYHLLVEREGVLSLSSDEEIFFSRPSIDVTLYSLAEAYAEKAIGVILTGANEDGARGVRHLENLGGTVIVQNPKDAEISVMPESAVAYTCNARQMSVAEISEYFNQL